MSERKFGNFSEWSLKELIEKERSFPVGHLDGAELRAEINRRYTQRNQRYVLASIIAAAISALGSMVAAIASLMVALHVK
jgi:hypothetical protein